jgi:putative phosphoribosyl transferase
MVAPPTRAKVGPPERLVEIPAGQRSVRGSLILPPERRGMVVFAHGSGSGRFSPRNQAVAEAMRDVGMGTLLIDLLEEDEAQDRRKVFDIEFLADRLVAAADWLHRDSETRDLRLGYFGASTGAGAALVAAARQPGQIGAVVSRGGRPDLAGQSLAKVTAPTLLLVGGRDEEVIELNRQALAVLRCTKEMVIIPGATHLFPEPGALEEVARLAQNWFLRFLIPGSHGHHSHGAEP